MKEKHDQYEAICIRCGACCGFYEDPCQHLKRDQQGMLFCEIYDRRFGNRKSVKGETFECVSLREIINSRWPGDYLCAYKKIKKRIC